MCCLGFWLFLSLLLNKDYNTATSIINKLYTEYKSLLRPLFISVRSNKRNIHTIPLFQVRQGYYCTIYPTHIFIQKHHHCKNLWLMFEISMFIPDIYFDYDDDYVYYIFNILFRKEPRLSPIIIMFLTIKISMSV